MIRQWLSQHADPTFTTLFAAGAFFFFLSVFLGAGIVVLKNGKSAYKRHGELPLNDD